MDVLEMRLEIYREAKSWALMAAKTFLFEFDDAVHIRIMFFVAGFWFAHRFTLCWGRLHLPGKLGRRRSGCIHYPGDRASRVGSGQGGDGFSSKN